MRVTLPIKSNTPLPPRNNNRSVRIQTELDINFSECSGVTSPSLANDCSSLPEGLTIFHAFLPQPVARVSSPAGRSVSCDRNLCICFLDWKVSRLPAVTMLPPPPPLLPPPPGARNRRGIHTRLVGLATAYVINIQYTDRQTRRKL